ncbi:hypothetical protein D3C87_1276200 [compost metagenome]
MDGWHGADTGLEAFDLMANGRDLAVDHLDLWVALGKARKQFTPQLLGLKQFGLQLN